MSERDNGASSLMEPQRRLLTQFKQKVTALPAVTKVEARSYPEALIVRLLVDSNDEGIWDAIADIEQDVAGEHPGVEVIFRECDLRSQSIQEFTADLPTDLAEQIVAQR